MCDITCFNRPGKCEIRPTLQAFEDKDRKFWSSKPDNFCTVLDMKALNNFVTATIDNSKKSGVVDHMPMTQKDVRRFIALLLKLNSEFDSFEDLEVVATEWRFMTEKPRFMHLRMNDIPVDVYLPDKKSLPMVSNSDITCLS